MAQTIAYYQNQITTNYVTQRTLLGLPADDPANWSRVSIKRLWVWVFAFIAYVQAVLWDAFALEVDTRIAALRPHTEQWYALKAIAFQFGYPLPADTDVYDNTGLTEQQIADSKIVTYAAVKEQDRGLRIKVAKTQGNDLAPLATGELTAFTAYMQRVKDAGVKLSITSTEADSLKLSLRIIYDPLVLNAQGQRIDGTTLTPVQDAISSYLRNLPFNGVFVLQSLVDALQVVSGVKIVQINSAEAKYGALPYTSINIRYTPDAGYLRIVTPSDLSIVFEAE